MGKWGREGRVVGKGVFLKVNVVDEGSLVFWGILGDYVVFLGVRELVDLFSKFFFVFGWGFYLGVFNFIFFDLWVIRIKIN